jgi:hypothetical protein
LFYSDEPEIMNMEIEEENIVPLDEPETRYIKIEEKNIVPPAEHEIKYAGVKAVTFIIGKIKNERALVFGFTLIFFFSF